MTERDGIFSGDEPMEIARRWLDEARRTEPRDAEAMALSTVDSEGMPNVRIVLLKEISADGIFFYTNYESAKAAEIAATGQAAMVLYWKSLGRQVRMRGTVERADAARSDAYFASRHPESRIGAWASRQSRPLESRQVLFDEVVRLRTELGAEPPRPPFWGGFRIVPLEIEFWAEGAHRLHDRFRWRRANPKDGWDVVRLNP